MVQWETITEPSGAEVGIFVCMVLFSVHKEEVRQLMCCCWSTLTTPPLYKHSPAPVSAFRRFPRAKWGTVTDTWQPPLACMLLTEGSHQRTLDCTKIKKPSLATAFHKLHFKQLLQNAIQAEK